MPIDASKFQDLYKVELPTLLLELSVFLEQLTLPCALRLPNQEWVLEIQYSLSLEDQTQENLNTKTYKFGVSYDGCYLLVDFMYPISPILQADGNDIDYLEVGISDILKATIYNPEDKH